MASFGYFELISSIFFYFLGSNDNTGPQHQRGPIYQHQEDVQLHGGLQQQRELSNQYQEEVQPHHGGLQQQRGRNYQRREARQPR